MFNEYFRQVSFFEGSEYANPDLEPYPFDPSKAREHLEKAGFHRPASLRAESLLGLLGNAIHGLLFTRSNDDDVLVNANGEKAAFEVIYGSKGLERHLTVMQQEYRRAGVDMRLRLFEPGTAFERGLERKFEATVTARTSSFYPAVREYLHSEFLATTNNNDIWGFGTPEVDKLIETYEEDLDLQHRLDAMHRIDAIVHDEAFYIPFWGAPYTRLVYWDYVQFPEFYLPKRTEQYMDYMVYWIDTKKQAALRDDMQAGRAYPVDEQIDKDFYGIRQRFQ
jgi:microcin C transport system substrate-binding protein